MTDEQARRAAALYYLDCLPVADIAKRLRCPRDAVRDAIDDPGIQAEYLDKAERARKRVQARLQAGGADLALGRQLELLSREDVDDKLVGVQQLTAERVLRRLDKQHAHEDITVTLSCGEIVLGMPDQNDD